MTLSRSGGQMLKTALHRMACLDFSISKWASGGDREQTLKEEV